MEQALFYLFPFHVCDTFSDSYHCYEIEMEHFFLRAFTN